LKKEEQRKLLLDNYQEHDEYLNYLKEDPVQKEVLRDCQPFADNGATVTGWSSSH